MDNHSEQQVVRLSFGWLVLGVVALVGLGVLGGVIGQQLTTRPLPPLSNDSDQLVTTVQEVTISPSVARAELVAQAERSVLLIVSTRNDSAVATGTVVTNDGLVATTGSALPAEAVGIDSAGRRLPLTFVGSDAVYGLTFYRISDNVVTPLDLRSRPAVVGEELVAISRNQVSFSPQIDTFLVGERRLAVNAGPGVQSVLVRTDVSSIALRGTPLLDDEGKLAGITSQQAADEALPINAIAASIERVSSGQREANPFAELGFASRYAFASTAETAAEFVATVQRVTRNSPASRGGLKIGDQLRAVGGQKLRFDQLLAESLDEKLPLTVSVLRNQQPLELTLTAVE